MESILQFGLAVFVTGLALIFLCIAGICATATYYGIRSVIDERKEKNNKKGKK